MQYRLITHTFSTDFEVAVNKALEEGFIFLGDVKISAHGDSLLRVNYTQAMIKFDPVRDDPKRPIMINTMQPVVRQEGF